MNRMSFSLLNWLWFVFLGLAAAYAVGAWMRPVDLAPVSFNVDTRATPDSFAEQDVHVKTVLQKNPMNLAIPQPKKKVAPPPPPPPPSVHPGQWRLLGTFTGENPVAIIRVGKNLKTVRQEGVEQGWTLKNVAVDHVLWEKDGRERRVGFGAAAKKSVPKPKALKVVAKDRVTLSQKDVEPLLGNPASLLSQALFKPHKQGGKIVGFRVRNIKSNSILKKIGLKNNDIIMRINGERVDGPTRLLSAYEGITGGRAVTLEVKRGKDFKSLLLDIAN
jgi:general secretion pathway protein C